MCDDDDGDDDDSWLNSICSSLFFPFQQRESHKTNARIYVICRLFFLFIIFLDIHIYSRIGFPVSIYRDSY